MKRLALVMLPGLLTACATPDYRSMAREVAVLAQAPTCPFQRLGRVAAAGGRSADARTINQTGAGVFDLWGSRVNVDKLLAELRSEAAVLGANAVIVRRRETRRDATSGSTAVRADEGLTLSGVAIKTEGSPTAPACGSPAEFVPTPR